MPATLLDLKTEAEQRARQGNLPGAFKVYRLVLESVPQDFDLRFDIADLLFGAGQKRFAAAIYQAISTYDTRAGNPLRALVALKRLQEMGVDVNVQMDALVTTYARDSEVLGRGLRPAPVDYALSVRDGIDLDYPMPPEEVLTGLAQMAAYIDNIQNYPKVVPPVAILSTLDVSAFSKLCSLLILRRIPAGQRIVSQGEIGHSMYFIARGEVRVFRTTAGDDESREVPLARLGPGSIFGEMALVSDDPRGASVVADGPVDILELAKEQLTVVSREMPNVAGAMNRFTSERMISNLMATHPMFAPFDGTSRKQLLARFVGHEVPSGTIFIEQGKSGSGLYILLKGKSEVLSWDGQEYVRVAALTPGDVAGEISLIHDEPATATVRTTTPSTLLFLARELFLPLVEAIPELLAHFARLANQRLADTRTKLEESRMSAMEDIEELEEEDEDEPTDDSIEELDSDDMVMI